MDKKNKNNVAKILLAFGVLASPMMLANQVSADNSIGNTTDTHNANTKNTNNVDATATAQPDAVTTYNVLNENKEEKEVVTTAAENNKAEATEEATSTVNTATDETEATSQTDEKSDENKEIVENKEEVDFKLDDSQKHALKEAGYTDEEIEGIENSIKHSLTEDSKFNVHDYITSKINDKKVETENPSLEISNDEKESVQAGEEKEAGRDISNDITEAEIHVGETNETGTLRADLGENLKWEVKFKAPDDTKAGDYFDIKLSDNWTLKGIEPDKNDAEPIKIGEKTIAVGKRIDRHHIRYTFTEDIDGLDDIQVNVQYGGYDDKEKIKYSSDQKFEIGVGDNKDEKDLYVNYGRPFYDQFGTTINGRSQYTSWNPETGEFTQVFYINPDSKFISSSNEDFFNNNVGVYIKNTDYDDKETQVKFTAENTTVDIVKLPSRTRIPDAVYENPVEGETDNSVTTTIDTNGISINLNKNSIDNPYIITLRSRINPDVEKINLGSGAYVYGNGTNHYLGMKNVIRYETGNTGGSGVEKKGSFQEHHIYQTKKLDGTIVEDSRDDKEVTEGTEKENYETKKQDKEGYTLVKVESKNGGQFNEDGSLKEAAYIADTKQEVTYIYQKEEKPVEKKGSFQEHHIYQTKKLDGTIVKDDEVNKDVTEGTEKENYTTSKQDRDGYKLIEVKSVNGGKFNEDGSKKEAAYIADTKQEVTYIYQKEEVGQTPLEETGKFQEHHIYITKDKDGKEIKREVVDGKVSGGTKDMTYTTGKVDKDGFKFVRTEDAKENPSFNEDGKETTGNFKPGVKQEITYVYEKTESEWTPIEETGKFQEHHIYITKDKDGKEIKREVVDGKVSGGTKDMTYTTGKDEKDGFKFVKTQDPKENPKYDKDGKETTGNFVPGKTQEITYVYEKTETPWTPLTPAEEVTPQTPDVKKTPKEDSKETPKDGSKETSEKQSKKLPKAGADYELLKLAAGALTIVSGFGISVSRKKRD